MQGVRRERHRALRPRREFAVHPRPLNVCKIIPSDPFPLHYCWTKRAIRNTRDQVVQVLFVVSKVECFHGFDTSVLDKTAAYSGGTATQWTALVCRTRTRVG